MLFVQSDTDWPTIICIRDRQLIPHVLFIFSLEAKVRGGGGSEALENLILEEKLEKNYFQFPPWKRREQY